MNRVAADRAAVVLDRQPDLLGLPMNPRRAEAIARRGAGRPPGARNKRSEDVARWIVEEIGDPLIRQAILATMPVEELAAAASCTVMEAIAEQRLAATLVLPYIHRRQPVAVDLTNTNIVHLAINTGGVAAAGETGITVLGTLATIEENQEVSDGTDAPV
jgi:hypothetical protein